MDEMDHRSDNPYTALEGYQLLDASRTGVGEVESTVYDAPSDVLKYIVVNGRAIPADRIEVDPGERTVFVPYGKETIESAPEIEDPSGAFDDALREHFSERG